MTYLTSEPSDSDFVARAVQGDEKSFLMLVDRYHARLLRLASAYVSPEAAAEVARETWPRAMAEARESETGRPFKHLLFEVLTELSRRRAVADDCPVSFSELPDPDDPTPPADWFTPGGQWAVPPARWDLDDPEGFFRRGDTLQKLDRFLSKLPPSSRIIVMLQDVEGLPSDAICRMLDVTEGNQRTLLQQGRAQLRADLESSLRGGPA